MNQTQMIFKEGNCRKCGSEHIGLRTDKRGVAEFYCEDCGTGLGKASSADLVWLIDQMIASGKSAEEEAKRRDVPCRYCTEDYYIRMGRMGTVYVPVEIELCPICGRKVNREKDRGV